MTLQEYQVWLERHISTMDDESNNGRAMLKMALKTSLEIRPHLPSIATPALIAELEKRRPEGCPDKCKHLGSQLCGGCFWNFLIGENSDTIKDNFKEAA